VLDEGRADFPSLPDLGELPREPRQERARAKRDALLRAASSLFAERGYAATTAPDIAEAASVSVGTFYSYFRDKRQILLALIAGTAQAMRALDLGKASLRPDPRRAIKDLFASVLPYDETHYQLQRAWTSMGGSEAEVADYGLEVQRWLYHQVLLLIRRVAADGMTWPDLDVERTAWTITVLVDHVWHHQLRPGILGAAEFSRQRDALADFVYHGIFRDPGGVRQSNSAIETSTA
jgi:AcrR family transcriptional regulator